MKKLLILLFMVFCSPEVVKTQTTEVEMLLNASGEVVATKTKLERKITWATILIRGTHRDRPNDGFLDNVPFIDSLYNKYFYRVILSSTGKDTVSPGGLNFREHQKGNQNIIRAFDIPKISITSSNIAQVRADVIATAIFDSLKNDEVENVIETDRWPWGRKERKVFFTLLYDNFSIAKLDSINQDSVKWKMNILFFRDSLIVCGKSLKNLTLFELNQCVEPSQKIKTWFQNNVLGRAGITVNTTIWELLKNHRGRVKNLWLRHSIFRSYLAKWIKRP